MKFFGRLFGEGKVKPTAVSGNLPPITKQYLHEKFGDYSKKPTPGKGGKIFDEAVRAWNAFDYDKAFDLLSKAVAAGLKGPERSTVHSLLGQIHIQWHQLDRAVDEFLKCLEIPDRVSSMTWQSAMHLYYIYSELGRDSEAKSVLSIAEKANEGQRWVHAAEAERETRDLTKHYVQK
jgi:tetratricopeptide (TPR) repeat protein